MENTALAPEVMPLSGIFVEKKKNEIDTHPYYKYEKLPPKHPSVGLIIEMRVFGKNSMKRPVFLYRVHNVVFELFMPHRAQKLQVCNTQPFQNSITSF